MSPADVLLIPGGAVGSAHAFPGLVLDQPVITVDRPGAGSHASAPTHLAEQAAWLAESIAGRGPVVAVAHSLGGPVAVQLALDHPSSVAGLVLLDPTTFTDAALVRRTVAAVAPVQALLRTPLVGRAFGAFATRGHRKDPVTMTAAAEMLEPRQWTALRALLTHFPEDAALLTSRLETSLMQVPGVIATAERKETSGPTQAHRLMGQLTGLRVEMWPGTTHSMHFERPDLVAAAVADLTRERAGGPPTATP